MSEITLLLDRAQKGDSQAAEELLPLVYDELRKLAARRLQNEPPGQTLQPTALVHEAWLKLAGSQNQQWRDQRHFFGAAAEAMRRILIDNARRKGRVRHGRGLTRVDLDKVDVAMEAEPEILLEIDEALALFARQDPNKAELLKLRYFAGLSIADAGAALGLSESTAKRYWNYARAWLHSYLATEK